MRRHRIATGAVLLQAASLHLSQWSTAKERAVMVHYHLCKSEECDRIYRDTPDLGRQSFEESGGNPIHVWSDWRLLRRVGAPIPDWIVTYLDQCADVVHQLDRKALLRTPVGASVIGESEGAERSREDDVAREISAGFGFSGQHGKHSAFTRAAKESQNFVIMIKAAIAIGSGERPAKVYVDLAAEYHLEPRTIERIYKDHELGSYFTEQIRGGLERHGHSEPL